MTDPEPGGRQPLSAAAQERLARPSPSPLRPPEAEEHGAVARWRRSIHRQWLAGDPDAQQCGHRRLTIGDVPVLHAGHGPPAADDGDRPLLLYLHGGGYALGSPEVALPITQRLAADCEVVSVDYRLAPEHPYPAGLDDCRAVFHALQMQQPGRPIVVAGDSAGANLALALALDPLPVVPSGESAAESRGPAGLIMFSPHLGFDPAIVARSGVAPVNDPRSDVDRTGAAWLSTAYRGPRAVDDPAVSPVLAPLPRLAELPPTLIQVGGVDSSLPHATLLADRLAQAGVPVALDRWPGLWHTWHYHRQLPEADAALRSARRFAHRIMAGPSETTSAALVDWLADEPTR